jgi:pilus assembly protein Flp/PilA
MNKLLKRMRDERGVTAIEYGMIAALVSIAIIVAVGNVGSQLRVTFGTIATALTNANSLSGN